MAATSDIIKKMLEEASEIQSFMKEPSINDGVWLAERLSMCIVYLARSGEMLAQAKKIVNEQIAIVSDQKGEKWVKALGPQLATKVMMGYCSDAQFLVDWLERINRGLVHAGDMWRSLLSYAKEEMRGTRTADEVRPYTFENAETREWE